MNQLAKFSCQKRLTYANVTIQLFRKDEIKDHAISDAVVIGTTGAGEVAWVFRPDVTDDQFAFIWDIANAPDGEFIFVWASVRMHKDQEPAIWSGVQYRHRINPNTGEVLESVYQLK